MNEEIALLCLHLVPNLGPIRIRRLLERFGSALEVLAAPVEALRTVQGISGGLVSGIRKAVEENVALREWDKLRAAGGWLLGESNPLYPKALRQVYNAPILLQVLGTIEDRDKHAVSIVGSRHCTFYGMECAKRFSYRLATAGLSVVSGLARGIDTAAHQGAIAAHGRTIAIIGSGLGQLYPPENATLAQRIAQNGAVLSEFPFDSPPNPQTFPYRNRIVAGWSTELLVVEAGHKSGALITANLALEQGRQVYAIPGPIDREASAGTNKLIQEGAKLVTCAEDILDELQELFPRNNSETATGRCAPAGAAQVHALQSLPPEEVLLLEALSSGERSLDDLVDTTSLSAAQIGAALLALELKKRVKPLPGQWYARA